LESPAAGKACAVEPEEGMSVLIRVASKGVYADAWPII
jgi:hypothetical protein